MSNLTENAPVGAKQPQPADETAVSLSPARATLAAAIMKLRNAQETLATALGPREEIARLRVAADQEIAAFEAEIAGVVAQQQTAIAKWVAAGATGARPPDPPRLFEASRDLADARIKAEAARHMLALADDQCTGPAEAVRAAAAERDRALWAAAREAAIPLADEMRQALAAALAVEARLSGLAEALRAAGDRDPTNGAGAYNAAAEIAQNTAEIRMTPRLSPDPLPGQALLDRLAADATAEI